MIRRLPASTWKVIGGRASSMALVWPRAAAMRRLLAAAREHVHDFRPALICGERGVGKSALMHAMHEWAGGIGESLVIVWCREPQMMEQSLAKAKRLVDGSPGRAVTVALEEVGLLPQSLMREVLLALRQRLGVVGGVGIGGVRLIATTREPLAEMEGIRVLQIPPLRERREDIGVLADRFLRRTGEEDGRGELRFTARARHVLLHHGWPGNIRELRSVVDRAAVMCAGREVDVGDLMLPQVRGEVWPPGYPSLKELERLYIERVVRESPTLEEAARVLEVDITTLWRKRRRYGI